MRYCTKARKSARRKSSRKPKTSRRKTSRRKTSRRKTSKPKKTEHHSKPSYSQSSDEPRYSCNKRYGNYGEFVGRACERNTLGPFASEKECLRSGCEEREERHNPVPEEYSKAECEKRWCTGLDLSKYPEKKRWKVCYRKNSLKYHPDKGGGEEAAKKFKELGECQSASDRWRYE